MIFVPDPAFSTGSVAVTEWPLCQVRLQDDARFPWIILIPRIEGAIELEDLSAEQRAVLVEETVRAGRVVRRIGDAPFKTRVYADRQPGRKVEVSNV